MKKQIISTLLAICLLIGMLPTMVYAESNHAHAVTSGGEELNWTAWDGNSDLTTAGNYYLTADVTAEDVIQVTADTADVNICLNGKKLDLGYYNIAVNSGVNLHICDCGNNGTISGDNTFGVINNGVGSTTVHSGTISGTKVGIYSNYGGSVTVNGGTVSGGTGSSQYGIQNSTGSTVTVNGGTVSGGTAIRNLGTANINGGTVSGGKYGLNNSENLVVSGGTIKGNSRAIANGGTITLGEGKTVKWSEDVSGTNTTTANALDSTVLGSALYIEVTAAEPSVPAHSHPICGATCSGHTGQEGTHESVVYKPLDSSFTSETLSAGSYYLTEDITLNTHIKIEEDVNLCLNGYTIHTGNCQVRIDSESAECNITDCKGTGKTGAVSGSGSQLIYNRNGKTNLFGIAVETTSNCGLYIYKGEMNVYGGSIKAGTSGIQADSGVLNIYGGEITAPSNGVLAFGEVVVNITGGTIRATNPDDFAPADVSLNDSAVLHLGGTPTITKIWFESSNKTSARIFAKCDEKDYTGGTIQLKSYSFKAEDIDNIIVSDVTKDVNDTKFSLDSEKYYLKLDETNQTNQTKLILGVVTHTVTLPVDQKGYTLEAATGSTSPVDYGGSFTFNFALAAGYSKTDNFAVKVNGEDAILDDNGSYTISGITEDIEVTVEGVADTKAPTGEITVGTNKWREFLNNITFGLFFKDTQSVEITAADAGSGVKAISYYPADSEKTEEELRAFDGWSKYANNFYIMPNYEYVIYAKLEDKAGNTAYINTDGLVLDNIAPVISGIEDGKTYCGAVEVTVDETYLDNVTVNGEAVTLKDGKFTVSPAEGNQKIVVTDKAKNSTEMTITVNDGHTLQYSSQDGSTIKETCTICGSESGGHNATAQITASDAVYAGSPIENAVVNYSDGWIGGDLKITYNNNDGAGQATASISKGDVTASATFTITPGSQNAPTGIGKKDENIDGKADGQLTNVNATMEYRKDGETKYTPITGNKVEDLEDGTYYVRYAENDNYEASPDSDPVVIAAGRKINVDFVVDNVTIATKQISWNGSIKEEDLPTIPGKIGYDQTPPRWDKTLGDLTNIQTEQDVSVFALYTINSYNVPLTSGEGYTLEAVSANPVNHGADFTFKVVIAEGYSKTDAFAVRYNGSTITPNADGSYTVTVLTDLVSPVVLGVADNTAPTGAITIDTNSWREFLNNITFGLFFKETQSVEITAADTGSGVREISYHIAEAEMTLEEVKAITDWQVYSGNFNIEPNHEYIIYAKLTDKAGNVSYINSNGVVLDNILPAISGIEDGSTYCEAVEVTVEEAYVDTVTLNGDAVTLEDNTFTVEPKAGEQTIVVTDKAGNLTEKTITVNDGHTWDSGKVTKKATTTEKGEKIYTCTVCGAAKTESIPALNETSKTGDDSNMWLWIALVLISGTGLTAAVAIGRKRKINR